MSWHTLATNTWLRKGTTPGNDAPAFEAQFRRFALLLATAITLLSLLPTLIGWASAPAGSIYVGSQFGVDDQMVYMAWIRQAMEGSFFFDNRFTIDDQPRLTVHLYFLVLGNLSRVFGLIATATLARALFSFLFVMLAARLVARLGESLFTSKLALTLIAIGGGIGFLVWQNFGIAFTQEPPAVIGDFLHGRLPIDLWQPEAFVFPSMLTNGLFMASLCLMLGVFLCILGTQTSWKPVLPGFLCMLLLMNIHSYDVLLVAMVLIGFLCAIAAQRQASWAWIARAVLIVFGALLPALWFGHVLRSDPVFQARAATETFSPGIRQVLFALCPAIVLGAVAMAKRSVARPRWLAVVLFGLMLAAFLAGSNTYAERYWLGVPAFALSVAGAMAMLIFLRGDSPTYNLVAAWAVVGLVAPYFPALFQRKLTMGVAIPWMLLAAIGIAEVCRQWERPRRNLVAALAILVFGATSIRWLQREIMLIRNNVSNTTVHSVYLSRDAARIIQILSETHARKIVIAPPGFPLPAEAPDSYFSPYLPDLNPMISGLSGAYTYAGHWSETPEYSKRRSELLSKLYLDSATDEGRKQFLRMTQADYLVAPVPAAFPAIALNSPDGSTARLADLRSLGEVVHDGAQFRLIKVAKH